VTTPPFVTYERTVRQTKKIALVTAENIGQIAQLVKGKVDYSSGDPELILPGDRPWRVRVGWHVELMAGDPPRISNANGFNGDGDWREVR